jgi:predicted TPR repeat methyltransferase
MGDGGSENLGRVYAARNPDEIARSYDAWADTYDAEMARVGYRHPAIVLALLCRHAPRGAGPVLDAGAGTGLIGEWLRIVGYGPLEGLDISEGMLAVAETKRVYDRLHRAVLGAALPFGDGHFEAVVSAGVFTTGHVGAEALDDLVRITKPGGALVLTIKDTVWNGGFSARVAEMARAGLIDLAEETPPYVSMPGEPDTVPGRGVVLKIL